MNRCGAGSSLPQSRRRAPLAALLTLLLLTACTSGDGPQNPPEQSYEEATAQVPLEGNDREPLFWRVDQFSDPDAAAAAEAVQYYFVVFDLLGDTNPINEDFFALMSHFATDERIAETRGWFPGPRSPSETSIDYTGPRWLWIMDVSELSDHELGVVMCTDEGWYGWHPDNVFQEVEHLSGLRWGIRGYVLRQVDDDGTPRWKVHDTKLPSEIVPEEDLAELDVACAEWATHDWEGN